MKKISILFAFMTLSLIALAHPGHGETEGYTIIHYIKEPVHLLSGVILSFIFVVLYRYYSRRKRTKRA